MSLDSIVDTAKNVATILALVVGSKYLQVRTYRPRLECSLEAWIEQHPEGSFLRVTAAARNVGLSRVKILETGTALLLYSAISRQSSSPPDDFPSELKWERDPAAFDVFTKYDEGIKWIDPPQTITHSTIIALPELPRPACKLALKVLSEGKWFAGRVLWTTEAIVQAKNSSLRRWR